MSKRDSEAANLRQQGLSYAQIAERMGISESAARGTASRGKRAVVIQDDAYTALLEEVQELRSKYTELKATVSGMYEPSARDDNDWATWDAEYKRLHGLDTHVQNILYHPRVDGSLIAVFGDRVFEVAAMADELRRTA